MKNAISKAKAIAMKIHRSASPILSPFEMAAWVQALPRRSPKSLRTAALVRADMHSYTRKLWA